MFQKELWTFHDFAKHDLKIHPIGSLDKDTQDNGISKIDQYFTPNAGYDSLQDAQAATGGG